MKKITYLMSMMFLFLTSNSQTIYMNELTDRIITDCFAVINLDDGNIVEVEDFIKINEEVPDSYTYLGINLIKMNEKAEVIDSAFVEFNTFNKRISHMCILEHNPYEENSYFLADFYRNDSTNTYFYNAVFFNNELDITNIIEVQFDDPSIYLSHRSQLYMDDNNDIVFCTKTHDGYMSFVKIDIYGNIIKVSHSDYMYKDYSVFNYAFPYDNYKSYYGFVFPNLDYIDGWEIYDGSMTLFIINNNLDVVDTKTLYRIDEHTKITPSHYGNMMIIRTNDDNLVLTSPVKKTNSSTEECFQVSCFNNDFELTKSTIVSDIYPYNSVTLYPTYHGATLCKDGSLYVTWCSFDDTYSNQLHVARLSKELNFQWKRCYYVSPNGFAGFPAIYVGKEFNDGGLVLGGTGGLYDDISNCPIVFIINNDGTSIPEYSSKMRPYSFYPNPAEDEISIYFSPDVNCKKVEIYGLDGRLYHEQNFNMETVNVSNLFNGVYMMKVSLDNGTCYTDKIVVK